MDHLEVHRAAPPIGLVLAVNFLLLVAEHEPVEAHADEVHHDCQRVQHVVTGLLENCAVRGLQGVLSKVGSVSRCLDARDDRQGRDDQGPVREWDQKAIEVHVEEISHVAGAQGSQTQPPHSLGSVDFTLRDYLLLGGEVLQRGQLVELVGVALSGYIIDVVRPVFVEVGQVDGLL